MTKLSVLLTGATGYIANATCSSCSVSRSRRPRSRTSMGFQIFYGISNNARTFWSISNARKVIGYQPEDDSEERFAEDIARMLREQ